MRQYQYSTKYQSWGALHLFTDSNTTYSAMSASEATTWTATSARSISASVLKWAVQTHAPVQSVNWQTWTVVLDADDISDSSTTNKFVTQTDKDSWDWKQDKLVSWTNIKTINWDSVLGSWDITIQSWWIQMSPTSPTNITYKRVGSEAEYNALSSHEAWVEYNIY